jgi:ribosomal protein L37E
MIYIVSKESFEEKDMRYHWNCPNCGNRDYKVETNCKSCGYLHPPELERDLDEAPDKIIFCDKCGCKYVNYCKSHGKPPEKKVYRDDYPIDDSAKTNGMWKNQLADILKKRFGAP